MLLKQKIYNHCHELMAVKIGGLKKAMDELREGLEGDSKSSAGDKHETGRAMAQLEQEKIGRQLKEAMEHKLGLEKMGVGVGVGRIKKGSLVGTNWGYIYIGVALGKIRVDEMGVIVVSERSPLGAKLMGLEIKDVAEVNGIKYFIESIE